MIIMRSPSAHLTSYPILLPSPLGVVPPHEESPKEDPGQQGETHYQADDQADLT